MNKIAILGIGGVGGYFGGLLARKFHSSTDVEVYFIARGEHRDAMEETGLALETSHGNFSVRPKMVTDDAGNIGVVDYLVCCTKSYHLAESINKVKACIGARTVILPLQNGVDSAEKLKTLFPDN